LAVAHHRGVTLWRAAALGQSPTRLESRGSHIGVSRSLNGASVIMAMRGYAAKVRSMGWLIKPPILATSGSECVIAWPFAGSGPQGKKPLKVGQGISRLVTHDPFRMAHQAESPKSARQRSV
jgi:hypothetical protein